MRAVIDQRGIRTEFVLDDAGRKTHDVFIDGTTRSYVHDELDRVVTQLDELGHGPTFGHDAVGRLTSVTDARGKATTYEHDDLGQLRVQRDALQRVTTFEHDLLGRRRARVLPLGQREEFGYTVTGVMDLHRRFNGEEIQHAPEPLTDRIASTQYPHDPPVSMTYTLDGMRETVTDSRGATVTTYDPERGWPLTVTQPDGTRLRYGYDDVGNRTLVATRALGSATEHVVEYRFDELNRLWKVIEPGGETTSYRYRADGLLETVTYPDYTVGTYQHDDRGRLRSVRWTSPLGVERYRQDITPDAAGRRELVVESMDGVPWRTATHVHDELDRLTSETVVVPGLPTVVRTYAYDDVGNRLHETVTEDGLVVKDVALSYDENDRLLTAGDLSYAWNVDGTLASITGPAGTTHYTWDDQERLVSATTAAGDALAYGYDADGLRVQRTANGATRRYLYDGSWAYPQVLEERDGAGALAARYTMGHRRIAENRGGERSAYLHDALGSTKALASADSAATVTDTWAYEAFGTIEEHAGTSDSDFLYAGEQWDPELGMQYLRARWMDPGVGRFGSRDPFAGSRTRPITLNAFAYADVRPLSRVDPSGQFSLPEVGIGAAIIGILSVIDIGWNLHSFITEPGVGNGIWLGVSLIDGPIPTAAIRRGAHLVGSGIAAARAARIVGKTGRKLLGETVIRGLVAGRKIADLTNPEIIKALHGAGWDVTHHFLQRLREVRTTVHGIETLDDVARLLNNGIVDDAGEGLLAVARGGIAVLVDPITKRIINIRPW